MIIGIPVYDDVDMLDVTGPYEMFGWAGITVELLADRPRMVRFRAGFSFEVTKCFSDAADEYDALWVPGGDPQALADMLAEPGSAYFEFLRRQAPRSRYVCSVCEGALLAAKAGLLDGYEATTHWYYIACLKQLFPKVKVVEGFPRYHLDRNRLAGGGISSGLDESLRLIELLKGTDVAESVQRTTQYYPCPPVGGALTPNDTCRLPPPRPKPVEPARMA